MRNETMQKVRLVVNILILVLVPIIMNRQRIMNYINVGDSLIKIKDENICYVKKPNGEKKQFYYTRISMKDRSHWTFPKEWKNKWMESSAWDTLQR